VSVPAIAATAQRSPASFYTYFDSKAALLTTLAGEAVEAFAAELRAELVSPSPVATLVPRVTAVVWHAYRRELPLFLSSFQAATRDLELEPWHSLRAALTSTIGEVDRRIADAGGSPPPDHQGTASALASMLEMFCFVWLGQGGDDPGLDLDDDMAIATLTAMWSATVGAQPE